MFFWAVESGCQRVLDAMDKGTNLKLIETVLQNSKQAGIWNHAFIVIGFPSEEREEAEQTLDFVRRHSSLIDSIHDSLFALGKYTRVEREPERFRVTVMRDEAQELQSWYPYIPEVGMSYFEAMDFRAYFQDELRKVYPNYDFTILPWPYLFLYLCEKPSMEVRGFHTGEERAQPEIDNWEKVIPRLQDGVFQTTRSFGLSKDRENVEKGAYHIVYDLFSDRTLATSSRAKEIITLSHQGENVGQIVSKLSTETNLPQESVKTACIEFVRDLAGRGFLTFDQER
jgi:anaerobic magnesium-protoporphyrin IX monomethyl ester cyclase